MPFDKWRKKIPRDPSKQRFRSKQDVGGLENFARAHGLTFDDPTVDFGRYEHFCRFDEGSEWTAEHPMAGVWRDMPVVGADFWTKGHFPNTPMEPHFLYSSIVIGKLALAAPHLVIWRKDWLDKAVEKSTAPLSKYTAGWDRIAAPFKEAFERQNPEYREKRAAATGGLGAMRIRYGELELGSPEFRHDFTVSCPDRDFATTLIDTEMQRWLMGIDVDYTFELSGGDLLVYSDDRQPPDQLAALFDTVVGFHDHIPGVVWSRFGTDH